MCMICFDSPEFESCTTDEQEHMESDGDGALRRHVQKETKWSTDYWLRLDCGHVCHADCLRMQITVGQKSRKPPEKFTFGFVTCGACREDIKCTDSNQQIASQMLKKMLDKPLKKRDDVRKAQLYHAQNDPVDKIEGIDRVCKVSPSEARLEIERHIGAFECSKCKEVYCESIKCEAADQTAEDRGGAESKGRQNLCSNCRKSSCRKPIIKCDLCCSLAKYRCADYYQCEMHHSHLRKTVHLCPGLENCPLGVKHPQNACRRRGHVIACGCGECGSSS